MFQSLTVKSGDVYLGKIVEYPTCWIKHLEIFDQYDQKIADVTGPCMIWRMGCNNMFSVKNDRQRGKYFQMGNMKYFHIYRRFSIRFHLGLILGIPNE